jgi:hypothetical protein
MYEEPHYDKDILRILREEHNISMSYPTLYRYKQRIQQDNEELWDLIGFDSTKARATEFLSSLEENVVLCKNIMNDDKTSVKDKLEASKLYAQYRAMLYRLVHEGPTFKQLSLKNTHILDSNPPLTNTNTNLNKDIPTQTTPNTTNNVVTTNKRVDNE